MQKNESIRVEMTFSKEQYEKLLQCKDLAAHLVHQSCRDSSLASLIEILADQYLKMKKKTKLEGKLGDNSDNYFISPRELSSENENGNENGTMIGIGANLSFQLNSESKSAAETRTKSYAQPMNFTEVEYDGTPPISSKTSQTETKRFTAQKRNKNEAKAMFAAASEFGRVNKSVTPKTRREIFARDPCCQFKDSVTGKQRRSTYGLQVDHKHSRWAGGDNSHGNLQNLCFHHNQYKYKKEANLRKR